QAQEAYTDEAVRAFNQANLAKLGALAYEAPPRPEARAAPRSAPRPAASESIEKKSRLKNEKIHQILAYREELARLDQESAEEKNVFLQELAEDTDSARLDIIADIYKAALSRAAALQARNLILRQELAALAETLPKIPPDTPETEALAGEAELLSRQTAALAVRSSIPEAEAELLREKHRSLEARILEAAGGGLIRRAAALAQKFLSQKGYEVLDGGKISPGKAAYLSAGQSDYRLQVKMSAEGSLTFQHLKTAASPEEARIPLTPYQAARDRDQGETLCRVQKELADFLAAEGLETETSVLQKPGQGPLPVLIDPRLKQAQSAGQADLFRQQSRKPAE
ncbi:MAG: hypothetical protein LBK52_03870, partial [Deltaproteobacteria bacterium]|nr:hypothetical protein [Deltaproteobacteria bacterium]